jgi:hypothetical protein
MIQATTEKTGTPYVLVESRRREFLRPVDLRAGRFLVYSREGFVSQHRGLGAAERAVERAAAQGREGLHIYEVDP